MSGEVLQFENGEKRYLRLAESAADGGRLVDALGLYLSALEKRFSLETLADIGDIYADMGIYELSNKYWFKYMEAAPAEKVGVAAEELAMNFFYMDNIVAAGYYFHKKASVDGFISWETMDPEIYNYFHEAADKRKLYYVAYPESGKDYSRELKDAKIALTLGDFDTAEKLYRSVPVGSDKYELATDGLSVTLMLQKKDEKAIAANKEYIKNAGENLSVLCNLSGIYGLSKDKQKSAYYYEKAKEKDDKSFDAALKLAACALDLNIHEDVVKYVKRIVDERPYDKDMRFFLAIGYLNCKMYQAGYEEFSYVLRLDREDRITEFYCKFCKKLIEGKSSFEKKLPLKYELDLPNFEAKRRIDEVNKIYNGEKGKEKYSEKDFKDLLLWAIKREDGGIAEKALASIALWYDKRSEIFKEVLMDPDIKNGVKETLLIFLIAEGYTGKISMVASNIFVKFKPKKLPFEKLDGGAYFKLGYAVCMARLAFSDLSDYDKIAVGATKVFKKFGDKLFDKNSDKSEIASLIAIESGLDGVSDIKAASILFGVREKRIKQIYDLLDGDNNDKNN